MYPTAKESYTSKQRRQKENKAKAKKRKHSRMIKNCNKLLLNISCQQNPGSNQIDVKDINENEVSQLNKRDLKWLKVLINESKFTVDAVIKIRGALKEQLIPNVFGDSKEDETESSNNEDIGSTEEDNKECDIEEL